MVLLLIQIKFAGKNNKKLLLLCEEKTILLAVYDLSVVNSLLFMEMINVK